MERWQGFLAAARLDLLAASACERDMLWAPAAFHYQQAAEKSLKALLSRFGMEFPSTHDVKLLAKVAQDKTKTTWPDEEDLIFLTNCHSQTRYPEELFSNNDPGNLVSERMAARARRTASSIHRAVARMMHDMADAAKSDPESGGLSRTS